MSELVGHSEEALYQGSPLRSFDGTFRTLDYGREFEKKVQIVVHPNNSRRIIINIPGTRGEIDGYLDKYKVLARHIQESGLAAVVRIGNDFTGYPDDINLKAALDYTKGRAWEISGEPKPELLLMGFSAGASVIAATAHEHPEVTRILLFAPAREAMSVNVQDGLRQFEGEVYIVIGDNDDNVGTQSGQILYDRATSASHRELFVLPNCDHQFRGEANGRIISEAPFYAFTTGEKPNFPDPTGGIKLY